MVAVIINLISIVLNLFIRKRMTAEDIQNYEIQIAVMVLIAVYNYVSTAVLVTKEDAKVERIKREKEKILERKHMEIQHVL